MQRGIPAIIFLSLCLLSGSAVAADGKAVYDKACKMCHGTGMMGAPKAGDSGAWGPRLEKGDEALLKSVVNGMGAMPARGGCRTCSDEELTAAIEYMTQGTQ